MVVQRPFIIICFPAPVDLIGSAGHMLPGGDGGQPLGHGTDRPFLYDRILTIPASFVPVSIIKQDLQTVKQH